MRVLEIISARPKQAKRHCLKDTIYTRWRILRLEENQVIRQVLMNSVKPTAYSLFGDDPDLNSRNAVELAIYREKWKSPRPSKCC